MFGHAATHVEEMWILHCCRTSGVAAHESQSQSCSEGLGTCAEEGALRLTQGMEQAMDVQMADVQICGRAVRSAAPGRTRGLSGCTPGGACRPFRHGSCAHGSRERTADADRIGYSACVPGGAARAVRKPRTLKQCSLGPRGSCWSWRCHCRRCEPSGTSRGA